MKVDSPLPAARLGSYCWRILFYSRCREKWTNQQAEMACEKVPWHGVGLKSRLLLDKGYWQIPFRFRGSSWQAFVRDRAITATRDEAEFIEEIERAVGLAIASGSTQKWRSVSC